MLAHELSHVAHRDVTVMTVASVVGVLAGFLTRIVLFSGLGRPRARHQRRTRGARSCMLVSIVVYALSFVLTRALSRYRELSADRAGAFLTGQPSALASALTKISGEMGRIPNRDLREAEPYNAFFFAPAIANGFSLSSLFSTHPTAGAPPRAAGRHLGPARPPHARELAGPAARPQHAAGRRAGRAVRRAGRGADPGVRDRAAADRPGLGGLPGGRGRRLGRVGRPRPSSCSAADGAPAVERTVDSFGYTWLLVRHDPADVDGVAGLVTDLHAVNSDAGRQRLRALAAVLAGRLHAATTGGGSGWSTSTSAARSTPSRRPATSSATRRSSCRCAACWAATCRSSRTCRGGSRCGARPASEPVVAAYVVRPRTRASRTTVPAGSTTVISRSPHGLTSGASSRGSGSPQTGRAAHSACSASSVPASSPTAR